MGTEVKDGAAPRHRKAVQGLLRPHHRRAFVALASTGPLLQANEAAILASTHPDEVCGHRGVLTALGPGRRTQGCEQKISMIYLDEH